MGDDSIPILAAVVIENSILAHTDIVDVARSEDGHDVHGLILYPRSAFAVDEEHVTEFGVVHVLCHFWTHLQTKIKATGIDIELTGLENSRNILIVEINHRNIVA